MTASHGTTIHESIPSPRTITSMDQSSDKEERKREYNRVAQRDFRRRRKQHLKNLEQAQQEQSSEQSEEIERLRYQNEELRRENEALRAQMYGESSFSSNMISPSVNAPIVPQDLRNYSLSPSITGTSISAASSSSQALGQDLIPMAALSLTSSMLTPSMQSRADPSSVLTTPAYSVVHSSGIRHDAQSSPELSDFQPRQSFGSAFQTVNTSQPEEAQEPAMPSRRTASGRVTRSAAISSSEITIYDRGRARSELLDLFRPLYLDAFIATSPERHFAILRAMYTTLPETLQPSRAQLETPHYYGIDMIASPSLRDRLLTLTSDMAQSFISEIGLMEGGDDGQLTIWGDEPLNEMSWEFSPAVLERWGWLLGREWTTRANWWRRQRGAVLLPEW